jgi:hypothetical protein
MKPWPSTSRQAYAAWLEMAKHHAPTNLMESLRCKERAEIVLRGFLSQPTTGKNRWR